MVFLMESCTPSFLQSFYQAISAGFPRLKVVIAKMDLLNPVSHIISIGSIHFYGDCKDGRVKFFLKSYFRQLPALSW